MALMDEAEDDKTEYRAAAADQPTGAWLPTRGNKEMTYFSSRQEAKTAVDNYLGMVGRLDGDYLTYYSPTEVRLCRLGLAQNGLGEWSLYLSTDGFGMPGLIEIPEGDK